MQQMTILPGCPTYQESQIELSLKNGHYFVEEKPACFRKLKRTARSFLVRLVIEDTRYFPFLCFS